MVGNHTVYQSTFQRCPELILIPLISYGRTAFELWPSAGDSVGREAEIMKARLDRELE